MSLAEPLMPVEFRHIETNGVALHAAAAGPADGPLVVLLHGFPEFWYGWRRQIAPLAAAGLRVVAPDQRGYNLSDKPAGAAAYALDRLADDVVGLAAALGRRHFAVVGHDSRRRDQAPHRGPTGRASAARGQAWQLSE